MAYKWQLWHFQNLIFTCSEYIATSITTCGKLSIIARSTVDPVGFGPKLFVDQRGATFGADKTGLVPVFFFVWQIFGVDADDFAAFIAIVGEHVLVTLDTVGMVVAQHVTVTGQRVVTVVAKHFLLEKFLNSFGLFALIIINTTGKNEIGIYIGFQDQGLKSNVKKSVDLVFSDSESELLMMHAQG